MIYIENEGALFRGGSRANPAEVYDFKAKEWSAYTGKVPKPIEWGDIISADEAEQMMAEEAD
jgi:hypothetical protein